MKNILVSGAAGFIGSHLAERCVELGYKVKGFIRYNSSNNWGWLEHSAYKEEIEIVRGDIRDFDSVLSAMKNVDTVFHLAALIGIPYSYVSSLAYIKTNIGGTYNVLEAAKMLQTNNIIVTSTSETYGTAQYIPIDENHPLVGQSPYSATKIGADHLALSFSHSFEMPTKIVRPFNTYGPRQSARAFIPSVIIQVLDGKKRIKVGRTDPTRDLSFVRDTVNGFLEIAGSEKFHGEVVNIGMNSEVSMAEVAKKIGALCGVDIKFKAEKWRVRPEKSEVERLCCDNSKLIKNTNWRPKYDLDTGLKETIMWFKENKEFFKEDLYNI